MTLSDLPPPAEASAHTMGLRYGFAQAGNRFTLFGVMRSRFFRLTVRQLTLPPEPICPPRIMRAKWGTLTVRNANSSSLMERGAANTFRPQFHLVAGMFAAYRAPINQITLEAA
jgi:hypothetical protein